MTHPAVIAGTAYRPTIISIDEPSGDDLTVIVPLFNHYLTPSEDLGYEETDTLNPDEIARTSYKEPVFPVIEGPLSIVTNPAVLETMRRNVLTGMVRVSKSPLRKGKGIKGFALYSRSPQRLYRTLEEALIKSEGYQRCQRKAQAADEARAQRVAAATGRLTELLGDNATTYDEDTEKFVLTLDDVEKLIAQTTGK